MTQAFLFIYSIATTLFSLYELIRIYKEKGLRKGFEDMKLHLFNLTMNGMLLIVLLIKK